MKKILLAFIFLGIFSSNAQIRIKMLDPTNNTVVIHNYGGSTINISSYWFCNFPAYASISSMTVNSGSTNLASGEEVNITSSINFDASDGEFGLYTTNASGFTNDMIDYLQWGSFGHQREPVANAANIWVAGTFISVSPPFEYTGTGSENGVSNWASTLSIDNFSLNNLSIYPNPSANYIHLKLPKAISKATVNVYDMLGKEVYSTTTILNDEKINIANLNSGIYLLKVSALGKAKTKRIIKL
ncbi:hypothetical protein GCM10023311_27800 [Flaviramulus aquimarinus]|uniref:Secretion system C-terminal sorting domain-containing protein n=1 Tax=Flaviramulus aquimarinus TaxID=1170456 RepID=A0ABP9FG67_9FLAO